ncbi:MAG: tetratricopeptide repeat protein [Polyangiaceae bacterium]
MLKVECESCKAPYQIDEKRIPAVGLKMRCPKCGHSFLVKNAGPDSAALPAALPDLPKPAVKVAPRPAGKNLKSTMVGVAPSGPLAEEKSGTPRPPISDFPGALGTLDDPGLPATTGPRSFDMDLPAVAGDLPAPARAAAPPAAAKAPTFELDLPSLPNDLPATRGRDAGADLPAVSSDLPAVFGGAPVADVGGPPRGARSTVAFGDLDLPSVASNLPAPSGNLPAVAANLPAVAANLPAVASNLPAVSGNLPSVSTGAPRIATPPPFGAAPAVPPRADASPFGDFGELDLPTELPAAVGQGAPAAGSDGGFGELDLGGAAPEPDGFGGGDPSRQEPEEAAGGMGFGELDFGDSGGDAEIATEAAIPTKEEEDTGAAPPVEGGEVPELGAEVPHAAAPMDPAAITREAEKASRKGLGLKIGMALGAVVVLGGAALQLTPYGAFGYLRINDAIHTQDYVRVARDTSDKARKGLAPDTFSAAKATLDDIGKTQKQWPRARALTAYAALTSFVVDLRFGTDGARKGRAQQWLSELPPTVDPALRQVTEAALAADNGELDKALKSAESVARRDAKDPLQLDIAILRGEIELRRKNAAGAVAAFQRATEIFDSPRTHYGLARAHFMAGDFDKAKKEVDATLAASPDHAAKILRAAIAFRSAHDGDSALKDLASILDTPAKENASPEELALAFAIRGDVLLQRGATLEAGKAYDEALKTDSRSVAALVGRGEAFFRDGRYAEALARFDTAVDADKTSTRAIAGDAKTKIQLERLADAKAQLSGARTKYPKDWQIAYWLGQAEAALGNKKPAEAEFRSAVELVDPTDDDAVVPFVGLSSFLAAQGRPSDAEKVLEEAQKKLPDSALMQRAVGQVAAVQADYDKAVAHFRLALEKDPKDHATRFQLAVTLRRVHRFDESSAEFEKIAAADPNYPGLALERGLLYEESGDVKKALEQFQSALAKAPNDADLQLRVGSAYVAINRPDEALPVLKKVLEARPGSAEAHHFIGRAMMITPGTPETQVMRYLRRAVELDPNRAEFHLYVGWAANEANPQQLGVAKAEIEKAIALDKLLGDAYWQYGSVLRKEGAVEDALKNLRRALELKPTRYDIHATLAETFEDKNDRATAASEWQKAIAGDDTRPFWRFRYGRILFDRNAMAEAAGHLTFAADKVTDAPRPAWAVSADFMAGEALRKTGKKAEAVKYFKRFLEFAQANSPDRKDAQRALDELNPER